MNTPNTRKFSRTVRDSEEQEEQALRELLTANLDARDAPRAQAVDEFAPEFLLQLDTKRARGAP